MNIEKSLKASSRRRSVPRPVAGIAPRHTMYMKSLNLNNKGKILVCEVCVPYYHGARLVNAHVNDMIGVPKDMLIALYMSHLDLLDEGYGESEEGLAARKWVEKHVDLVN